MAAAAAVAEFWGKDILPVAVTIYLEVDTVFLSLQKHVFQNGSTRLVVKRAPIGIIHFIHGGAAIRTPRT